MPSRRDVLAGLGSITLAGTAGCLGLVEDQFSPGTDATTDWPMPRYDPVNTGFVPDANAPRSGVIERWAADPGYDVSTPAVVDGTVFTPAASGLAAIDGGSGEELWRFRPTEHDPWPTPPVVHDGTVYVTMADETLYAVAADSGEERWSVGGASRQVPPHLVAGDLVNDPLVLVGGENGVVRALDPDSGAEQWRLDTFGGVTAMAYYGRGFYVGTTGGEVYSYFPEAGRPPRERWRRKLGGQISGIIPTSNGIVVSAFGASLVALRDNGGAGSTAWIAEDRHAGFSPVYAGSYVYSAGPDSLSSIRVYDQNLHWRAGDDFGTTAPVAAGDTLYVPKENSVIAFDLGGGVGGSDLSFGGKRWEHRIESGFIQGLAVADGALFVACEATEDGNSSLFCLESA
jgi:outer membrane protein assembly factor BamB